MTSRAVTFDALDPADQRRGVGADRHRDRGLVDVDQRQRLGVLRVGEGLADGDLRDPGDRADVARAGGLAGLALQALRDQQLGDLHVLGGAVAADPGDLLALAQHALLDPEQREAAQERRGVQVGDVGLQRRALVVLRGRDGLQDRLEQRLEVLAVGERPVGGLLHAGDARLARRVDDREVQRVLAVAVVEQVHEQLVGLVDDLGDPGVAAVDLVDDQDHRHVGVERLAEDEPGLGERALGRVDQQHDPVDHRQPALDLAAEVGVTGGVDDVDRHRLAAAGGTGVVDRGVLREDGDPLLALEVAGVHHPLREALGLVGGERSRLVQHRVDERRLAVVDVRDDRDVAEVGTGGHGGAGVFREGNWVGRSHPRVLPPGRCGGFRKVTRRGAAQGVTSHFPE